MTSGNSLKPVLQLLIICSSEPREPTGGQRLVAGQTLTILGDLASTAFVFDDGELVTGSRRTRQAEDLDRHGRARFLDVIALVVDQSAHTAPLIAGHDDLAGAAYPSGRARSQRATATVELGFDDRTFGRPVGWAFRSRIFGLQQHASSLSRLSACSSPNFDVENFTTHGFDEDFVLQKLWRTFSGSLSCLSILLIATMIGTPAALAWLIDSIVCGITLSSAATTRIAMSLPGRHGTHRGKRGVAGVSMKVIF